MAGSVARYQPAADSDSASNQLTVGLLTMLAFILLPPGVPFKNSGFVDTIPILSSPKVGISLMVRCSTLSSMIAA